MDQVCLSVPIHMYLIFRNKCCHFYKFSVKKQELLAAIDAVGVKFQFVSEPKSTHLTMPHGSPSFTPRLVRIMRLEMVHVSCSILANLLASGALKVHWDVWTARVFQVQCQPIVGSESLVAVRALDPTFVPSLMDLKR